MKIDVITSVRDGEEFILQVIESVQRQTVSDWKYIIIDDGSTDATADLIREAALKDERIHYLGQAPSGVSKAANAGMRIGSSPLIAFIDVDDLWHPNKLQRQLEVLDQRPELNYCFTVTEEFDELKHLENHNFRARKTPLRGYLRSSLLFRRRMLVTYGYFDESVVMGDFIDWLSGPIHAQEELFIMHELLTYRRVHGSNMTAYGIKKDYLKVLKKHLDRKRSC